MRSYRQFVAAAVAAAAVLAPGLSTAASATGPSGTAVEAGPIEDVFTLIGHEDEWYYYRDKLVWIADTKISPLLNDVHNTVENLPPPMATTPGDAR